MKLIKNSNLNLPFPKLSGSFGLWLLLMGLSINSYSQIHVSDNTILSVKEGTVLYVSDESNELANPAKIYVTQNIQLTNFPNDSLVEIVYLEKQSKTKKSKEIAKQQKKTNKLAQRPVVKKDIDPEKTSVISFTSTGKTPSTLLYAGKTTKATLVQSGSFLVKLFPPKKAKNNTIHTISLNDSDQQIQTSFAGILPKPQNHLENQITRPPPISIA